MQAISNGAPPSPAPVGTDRATEAGRLEGLAELASGRMPDVVERTLALAREALGMEVAFVSEFAGDRMEFRALEGDAGSFSWREGGGVPLEGTFCKRVDDGTLPNVVPDAENDRRVSGLEVTREAGIGSSRPRSGRRACAGSSKGKSRTGAPSGPLSTGRSGWTWRGP